MMITFQKLIGDIIYAINKKAHFGEIALSDERHKAVNYIKNFFFFLVRSAMRQPFRAVMQHLGGSWDNRDKRHAMRFYVLHVALGLRSASYVQGTYEDVTNMPPIPN